MLARSIFMSLDYEAVQSLQRQRPQWWIGYCVYGTAGEMDYRIWNWNIDFLAVEESQISVSFLEQAGRAWMPIYVWTVDDYNKMSNYLDMGVSGLITEFTRIWHGRKRTLTWIAIRNITNTRAGDTRSTNGKRNKRQDCAGEDAIGEGGSFD